MTKLLLLVLREHFIKKRLPDSFAINVVKEEKKKNNDKVVKVPEEFRTEMWLELAQKNIWEGFVELKKKDLRQCIEHRRYSKGLEDKVWNACLKNSRAYKQPRFFYFLEAFGFEGKRILLDKSFSSLEEQIIFPIIKYVHTSNKA